MREGDDSDPLSNSIRTKIDLFENSRTKSTLNLEKSKLLDRDSNCNELNVPPKINHEMRQLDEKIVASDPTSDLVTSPRLALIDASVVMNSSWLHSSTVSSFTSFSSDPSSSSTSCSKPAYKDQHNANKKWNFFRSSKKRSSNK